MATGSAPHVLITSASRGRTLDVEARTRRYLITMSVRTACFIAFLVVPGWWKVVALAGAALLPAVAVLLANNADHRPPPLAPAAPDDAGPLALPPVQIIPGRIEEEDS
ncbi:MAG: DUF3099 domain-containing protein [Arachnia sp.]